jgi:hypothetical protein
MVKVSGVPYDVKMELTDERILELAKQTGASKVFVAGYAISGDKKIIEFARLIESELSK